MKSDAELAKEQGVSRSAISNRRKLGWSEEELQIGKRLRPRKKTYRTQIARDLGMSVKEAAEKHGVSIHEIYRRYNLTRSAEPLNIEENKEKVST